MNDTLLGVLGTAFAAALLYLGTRNTNFVTRRRDEKANQIDAQRADGEAYDRAVKVNKEITDALKTEMERLQAKVNELSEALDKAIDRARKAESERDVAIAQLGDPRLRLAPPTGTSS